MAASIAVALLAAFLTPLIVYWLTTRTRKPLPANLPPGSLGLPVIGQSLGLLRAMRSNTGERWLRDWVDRYGPVSKLSLFGAPTVFVTGPAANKLVFGSDALAPKQPRCLPLILGRRNILELVGDDYRRVRGAMMQFLKPDMLRRYVGTIDAEVTRHLDAEWAGRRAVTVLPLMKLLTFDIIATLLFGLERGAVRERLAAAFADMLEGMWSVPLDLPFTAFRKSLRASARARRVLEATLREKRARLERGESSPANDLVSCLASLRVDEGGGGKQLLTDEEIVDNAMVVLVAGHDTSSVLMTFMIRHLAGDPATLSAMVQEHEEIAKNKADGEALTWEDLHSMRLTWRVALETLRMIPPIFGSFRRALEDIELDGYVIPKGWQVFWASSVTHMDPGIFKDPEKFDPSRFEGQAPPYSFVAFGGGQRLCAGIEFARVETLVTMHHLVRRFRWRLCSKENTFVRDPMPSPLHGLPIELEHMGVASPCKTAC
ncbi:hypothetical protein GQ55_2G380400 [Panicum hallii var. hallii]|uniref:Cytochrome P450 716B1 n=1 Tax=Panicum hallii var. hallii TaxID=1504633 RepID=A0A2T7EWT5_9POAL|nr:hypothetical protein GQ55_2G380400 [Panicum hallii var. hallii]